MEKETKIGERTFKVKDWNSCKAWKFDKLLEAQGNASETRKWQLITAADLTEDEFLNLTVEESLAIYNLIGQVNVDSNFQKPN